MDMYEAVTSRGSVCGFADRHVPREVLERVLSTAAWASPAPDLQSRRVYVLTGRPLAELEKLLGERDPAVGAPAVLFCYVDRDLGPAQWSDIGMYLRTVMLLLRAEGLHSRTQMAWAKHHRTVAEILSPPEGLILFCGISIGFEGAADAAVSDTRAGRVSLDGAVAFVDTMGVARLGHAPAEATRSTGNPVARLNGALARKIRRIMSQIGLPP
ncbi:nitroreductase [Streptomyces phaeochromogenes]|uniref:nitroreductase n=1 Tax=Streptomyces phaeochromogenes TaxID=1923 RepID=UPI0033D78AED